MRVPREAFALVGRSRELAAVTELSARSRLLTIWGAGGVGKTRLAQRLARGHGDAAWFCDLSNAGDEIGLCAAIAYRLGAALDDEPVRCIGRWLSRRGAALLVLDNFEQLAHLGSATVSRFLDEAPELRIVITSRERLRLQDEVCYELGPLGLPGAAHELLASESYQLLLARLRAIDPSFMLADAEAPRVVELLAALEGLPLAIELAAPRVALLGVSGVLERLEHRLDALAGARRGVPERQANLRQSIRWSWELLDPDEQRALAWCSVFRGGFAADAAEAMFGEHGVERLRSLRDGSLLRTLRPGRFALYESVREFAGEQLEARGERIAASQRHAAFTVQRCRELSAAVEERGEPIERLQEERWNLEQALRWSVAAGEREHAVQCALALGPVLSSQGPLRYFLDALGLALQVAPLDPRVLHARGKALQGLTRLTEAERDLRAALDSAQDVRLRARIAKDLGVLYHQRREVEQAARCYAQALELADQVGERRLRGLCVGNQGALCHDTGDYTAAAQRYEEALAIVRGCGDLRTEGVLLTNLAVLHQELERWERARSDYKRAINLLHGIGDLRGEGVAATNLAVLEHLDGNLQDSREHHERACALLETVGDERSEALCRARLGAVLAQLGERSEARAQLERSAALLSGRDDALAHGVLALYRGFLELAEGDRGAALARLRAARERGRPAARRGLGRRARSRRGARGVACEELTPAPDARPASGVVPAGRRRAAVAGEPAHARAAACSAGRVARAFAGATRDHGRAVQSAGAGSLRPTSPRPTACT